MFKKLLPIVMLVFIAACSNTQGVPMSGMDMKTPCCEKCECCKDGMCKMCVGETGGMSSMKEGMQCPIMKHSAKDGKSCGCCRGMMKDGIGKH